MRILFITNNYTPYSGGVVSSINASIQELQAQGHHVTLITLDFLGAHHNDPLWVKRIPSLIRFRFKQNYMAIPWRPALHIAKWMAALKPDVVHIHHPFLLGPIAMQIAKQRGIPTVFTYHTVYEAYAHYVPLPQWITKPIVKKRVLSFCKNVDHIIAPSYGVKDYLYEHGITWVTVIPSGIQSIFLQQPFIKKELQKPYQLLYVGRFVKEKNIPFLLDVLAQLPDDYHCTLVGYGAYEAYLKRYAYNFHSLSKDRVRFIIKPDKATLLEVYRNAHLFLFASQSDTQGLVLLEAMACSTPVIALDGFGQRDVICQGNNGFIVANRGHMSSSIEAIVHDPMTYHRLQVEAYKTTQSYTPDCVLEPLITLYAALRVK